MAKKSEPFFTYQGVVLLEFEAARTPGLESDHYSATMTAHAASLLRFERPDRLYDPVAVTTRAQGPGSLDGLRRALEGGLAIRGDLEFHDGERTVTIPKLYVRDDGVEVVSDGDDEDGVAIVRLSLVDVRYFWSRRGDLWGTFNLKLPNGQWDPRTVKPVSPPPPRAPGPGFTEVRDVGNDDPAYTLLEIVRKIAAALPGTPPVSKFPAAAAGKRPILEPWRGASPKDELDRLAKKYGLTVALDLSNHLNFTDAAEAPPAAGRSGAARELGGASLPEGRWRRRRRRGFVHRPEAVRIVGPPVVREVRLKLVPIAYGRDPKTLEVDKRRFLSVRAAAAVYGVPQENLGALALLPDGDQAALLAKHGQPKTAVAEIEAWNHRLFRLQPAHRGFLPALAERAESLIDAADGQDDRLDDTEPRRRLKPLVEADQWEEVRKDPDGEAVSLANLPALRLPSPRIASGLGGSTA